MKKTLALVWCATALCLTTGCYNNPENSLRKPGEGPAAIHSKPAVGPGTVAGGSTAGPQPANQDQGGHGTRAEDASNVDTSRGHAATAPGSDDGHSPAPQEKH